MGLPLGRRLSHSESHGSLMLDKERREGKGRKEKGRGRKMGKGKTEEEEPLVTSALYIMYIPWILNIVHECTMDIKYCISYTYHKY